MDLLIPKKLKKGDTIGILSVSGVIEDKEKLEKAKIELEEKGYKVKISQTSYTQKDYLCAEDTKRAEELNNFFKDKSINAILATRGGYGAIRILDLIDYEAIKENPKIFAGYSDITALSIMLYRKAGLVTYNAPMAYSDFASDISEFTKNSFFNTLENGISEISIENNPKTYYSGIASGILWGGNLSTLQSLCGLDFIPDEKFILLIEDINEPVYKIDKMLTQLLNIPKFKNKLGAIVFGDFSNIDNENYFENLISELANRLKIPTIKGLKFGHEKDKLTFPIGINAILDTNLNKIILNKYEKACD